MALNEILQRDLESKVFVNFDQLEAKRVARFGKPDASAPAPETPAG